MRNLTSWRAGLVVLILTALAMPAPASAAEPVGFAHFHTYAEVERVIDDAVAAHPGIALKFRLPVLSHEGREIWGIKISDNVAWDESEPEIFMNALMHARERVSTEMAIYVIKMLVDGYGSNQRITEIVNSREIWIVPMMNPDGAEYDFSDGVFHRWRKNRQPIPGSSAVGIDLNRGFSYKWACCGGSSANPHKETYHGPSPWYAPEDRAYRDFVNSRVVNGRQQIRALLSWHSAGRQVLWPYAYTKADLPRTMSADDHATFVAFGRQLAKLNGYKPEQSSDLYIVDGDQDDWAYHEHRIFAYTFELPAGSAKRYYPTAQEVLTFTSANRQAVLYFLEQAACPYRVAGLEADCGALYDDFETGRGWTVNPYGTDSATKGRWQRAIPQKTRNAAGVKQRAVVPSGQFALVTGAMAGATVNANDVDGGTTSILSPSISLGTGSSTLRLRYSFAHNARASSADHLRLSVVRGATTTLLWTVLGRPANRNAQWLSRTINLDAYAGQTIRLLIEARDGAADSLIEAAIDDIRVY